MNICMKEFISFVEPIIPLYGFCNAWIVPLWADQLILQLLMQQLILCRYNVDTLNICMKEFIIFVCTDSTEISYPKVFLFEL